MYIEQMRKALEDVYPAERWRHRVSKMSDGQVMAVYYRFLYSGEFERVSNNGLRPRKTLSVARKEEAVENPCKKKNIYSGDLGTSDNAAHQVTVFDILREFNLEEEDAD